MIQQSQFRKPASTITILLFIVFTIITLAISHQVYADTALNSSNWLGSDGSHYWYVNNPGTYFLDTDGDTFITDNSVAIKIAASNVTIDGRGKKITSSGSYPTAEDENAPNMYGVRANAGDLSTNITVENLTVEKKYFGIIFEYVNSGTIANNSTSFNHSGIYLWKVEDNVVSGNTSSNNQHSGIVIDGDYCVNRNNLITDNSTCNNNEFGILLWLECPNSTITNNFVDSNGNSGIAYGTTGTGDQVSNYTTIQGNTSTNNLENGLHLKGSFHEINNNNFSNNANIGIWLDSSNNNNITDNTTSGNQTSGIWLGSSSTDNLLEKNTSCNNSGSGIELWGSPNNTISDNTLSGNVNTGIVLGIGSDYTTVQGNISGQNSKIGMNLQSSFNDITDNSFNDNSNCGLQLIASNNNNINDNTISNNLNAGVWLARDISDNPSTTNTLTGNIITENRYWGIFFSSYCNNNLIYNNYFLNYGNVNLTGTEVGGTWSTTLTTATNIIGGPYIGGNFWGKPDNTGFSQTTSDSDLDGICDAENNLAPYNLDNFPLHCVAPVIKTESATAINYESAMLNGTIQSGGSTTTVVFEYGLTADYTDTVEVKENPFNNHFDKLAVSVAIANLNESTTYHYRIKASNSEGDTVGEDQTFETTLLESMYINKDDGLCNDNNPCLQSLQDGIDQASPTHRINVSAGYYAENIILDSAKTIIMQGGYDPSFTSHQGITQIFSLTVTDGTIIIGGICVEN